jgi:hypothetical protein
MRVNSKKLLDGREVLIGSDYARQVAESRLTVFLGVYNGAQYLDLLLGQLLLQEAKEFPLLIVENASTDGSWEQIGQWPLEILRRAKLVRNPINVGGIGTLVLNLFEVETPWLVSLHQDDIYLPNHLRILKESIDSASEDEVVHFTDMGTVDLQGRRVETLIRQSWIADLSTREASFIANLVQQSVSYASAAFRTSALSGVEIPWHSTSFPDTEITLRQSPIGKFKFIPEQTMLYRVNPDSTSRDLGSKERILGPLASLARVMGSESFYLLCSEVAEESRQKFSKAVLAGIQMRLGESPLCEIVKLIAAETMALAWDYTEKHSREQILITYKLAEAGRTTKLLDDLGAFYAEGASSRTESESQTETNAQIELEKLLSASKPLSNVPASRIQSLVLGSIGRFLPLPIRRKVVSFVVRIYARLNPTSPWNLSWKPKS